MLYQTKFESSNPGRGIYEITDAVGDRVAASGIHTGLSHVFIHHTSASLIVCENADPAVLTDLEHWMARTVPDGDPIYAHTQEGADDMPAHVRSILTQTNLTLPVTAGRLALGTWQGIYVWEHRFAARPRSVTVTVQGDGQEG